MKVSKNKNQFEIINFLRGFASLGVAWYHFTCVNSGFIQNEVIRSTGRYGWLGVEIFFVISGFVIPWSLYQSGYQLSNFFKFILKRIARLYPPFLAATILIIVLAYLSNISSIYKGDLFKIDFTQIFLNLVYLNSFFGYKSLNPVFWTLGVELQYYIAIGLIFPLLIQEKLVVKVISVSLFTFSYLLYDSSIVVFHWSLLFLLGIFTFYYKAGFIYTKKLFYAGLAGILVLCCLKLGIAEGVAGCVTAYFIAFVNFNNKFIKFFGDISYSLYLLHVPIGGRVINLSRRFVTNDFQKIVVLGLATIASIGMAYLLYKLVERPSQRLSSAIRYKQVRTS